MKQSRVRSTMRWWTKCISMVIAKTASRNVAFKANVMSQAVLEAQSTFVMSEATDQDASSLRRSLNDRDVVCNADLCVFNNEVDNGYASRNRTFFAISKNFTRSFNPAS